MSITTIERERAIMACSKDPLFFGKLVAPQYFFKGFAPFHKCMLDEVNNRPAGCDMVILEVPRGFGKSLLVSTLNPLHRVIFSKNGTNKIRFVVIASFSGDRANLIIGDYKNIIEGENFRKMFPDTRFLVRREDFIEVENIDMGFKFAIMARGRKSQVAGMRYEEARPQIFIGDDLENPDQAYDQQIVEENERFVKEVVQYGLDTDIGYSILIGTPFAFDCTTQRFTRNYPLGVRTVMYPGLVSGVHAMGNRKAMTAEEMSAKLGVPVGCSIWESKFPTEVLLRKRDAEIASGNAESFMRQIMLDPRSEGSVRIPLEKMKRISADRLEDIKKMPMNVYILADFAYSQQLWADESAYIVVGVDGNSNHYIFESDSGKWGDTGTTAKIMDKVIEYKANLRILGVETRGLGHVEREINDLKRRHNLAFGFEELKPKNRTKPERIKSTISLFDNDQVYIIDGKNRKFEEQASRFRGEKMDHGDDIIDAWGYIREDFITKPETPESKEEKEKLRNHLEFERWAASQPDWEKKRREQTGRVRHAMGMRPNYF